MKTRSGEAAFLARYRPADYPRPSVTVDLVILTVIDAELRVLLIQRKEHPYKGSWALPGGFVRVGDGDDQGEDLDAAAIRELGEETGLGPRTKPMYLEQLHTFGRAGRDPRMRVITVAYFALVPPDLAPLVVAGGDAAHAEWVAIPSLRKLAFDHAEIIRTALTRVAAELDRIASKLVPSTFTIPELRSVYTLVTGQPQDPGNFRRRFNRLVEDGVIEKAAGKRITSSKPATVYRFTG